jgi:spore maturation protein SpmA
MLVTDYAIPSRTRLTPIVTGGINTFCVYLETVGGPLPSFVLPVRHRVISRRVVAIVLPTIAFQVCSTILTFILVCPGTYRFA